MKVDQVKRIRYGYEITLGDHKYKLEDETLLEFHINKGKEINDKDLSKILEFNDKAIIKRKALLYLKRPKSVKTFKTYLEGLMADEALIHELISSFTKMKYLDDREYAKMIIHTYQNRYGYSRIKDILRQKGIPLAIIESLPKTSDASLEEKIKKAVLLSKKPNYSKAKETLTRQFLTKGYTYEEINPLIDKYLKTKTFIQENHIKKAFLKLYKKYEDEPLKVQKDKIKQALYRQGFDIEQIDQYFIEMGNMDV